MKNTKTSQAKKLAENGHWNKAMKILKTFRIGITKEEKRTLEIASDLYSGNTSFYKMLGIDIDQTKEDAIEIGKRVLQIT